MKYSMGYYNPLNSMVLLFPPSNCLLSVDIKWTILFIITKLVQKWTFSSCFEQCIFSEESIKNVLHWIKHIHPARREGRHEIKVSPLIPANAAKGLTACKLKQLYEGSLVKSFKQVYKYLWTFCRINTRFDCNSVFSLLKNYKNEETSLLFYKSILKG